MHREVKNRHVLENAPLKIKTDSTSGSEETVQVWFYNSRHQVAGGFYIQFSSPPKYKIFHCTELYTDFLSFIPSEVDKIWTFAKLPGPKITLHCNGVKVVDVLLLGQTCDIKKWKNVWNRDAKLILFNSEDSASDYYYKHKPGSQFNPISLALDFSSLLLVNFTYNSNTL